MMLRRSQSSRLAARSDPANLVRLRQALLVIDYQDATRLIVAARARDAIPGSAARREKFWSLSVAQTPVDRDA
jgi:hypothetical protein